MAKKSKYEWFSDDGPGLDRFGWVLGLSALSVTVLSLIDLDDVGAGLRAEIGWIVVTITVGLTLVAALRASGVAKRPRRIAEAVVVLAVTGVLLASLLSFADSSGVRGSIDATRPSVLWTLLATVSPLLVLRRVMKHPRITLGTLLGALSVYLLLALAYGYAFLWVEGMTADWFFGQAESTSSFMYFSLVTITTVGYGDLSAVGDLGRFLASSEAVLGQVLLVTVVARLVALYSASADSAKIVDPTAGEPAVE